MTFDKGEFLGKCTQPLIGFEPRRVALAVCKEIAMLHAEIAALKARLPEVPEARDTGWVVKDKGDRIYTRVAGFESGVDECRALWFPSKDAAEALIAALGYGHPSMLYMDTMEEVAPDA